MTIAIAQTHQRLKPFAPLPQPRNDVIITDRDVEILYAIWLRRLATAEQIAELLMPAAPVCPACKGSGRFLYRGEMAQHPHCRGSGRNSWRKIMERIGDLWANGYLSRPPQQLEAWRPMLGSQPFIYGLGKKGLDALIAAERLADGPINPRALKDRLIQRQFIRHTVATTAFSCALNRSVHLAPDFRLLEADALIQSLPAAVQNRRDPLKLTGRVRFGKDVQSVSAICDWAAVLSPALPANAHLANRNFLIEIDNATEPIRRATLHGTSLIKKMRADYAAYIDGQHQKLFNWPDVRWLIVTTTPARIDNILAEMERDDVLKQPDAARLFYFATQAQIDAADDLFDMPWRSGARATVTLLPAR